MKQASERKILVLYTGGTIGMVPTNLKGGLKPGSMEMLQQNIPGLEELLYRVDWSEFKLNDKFIDSSDANIELYQLLGDRISKEQQNYDGIVVVFGTDTMGPSAGALSYELQGLKGPVVFTGSMIPAVEEESDGPRNLLDAIEVAAQSGNEIPSINEVTVCFAGKLFRAVHTRKFSASDVDAMDGVTEQPIATLYRGEISVEEDKLYEETEGMEVEFNPLVEKDILPIGVCSEMSDSIQAKLKAAADIVDAIVLFDLPHEQPLNSESKVVQWIQEYAPNTIVFFADQMTEPPNSEWLRLRCVPDFQQIMIKANYVLSRSSDKDEMRMLADSNLRGETKGELLRESERLSEMRKEREIPRMDKR
ncbi:asparaginase [Candidatus Nomurabacteria bacterium]|nr:asparaginase [Candidatus Nomurabacteria bacterium]